MVRCKCPKCGSPNLKAPAPFLDSSDAYLPPDPPLHTLVECKVCDAFVMPIFPEPEAPATVSHQPKYGSALTVSTLTVADCYDMPMDLIRASREIQEQIKERMDRYFLEGR